LSLITYGAEQIEQFLRAVDRHLMNPTRVVLIGGSAAALAYRAGSTTDDIDTLDAITAELNEAIARAVEDTGLDIVMQKSTVADAPYDYDTRLERQLPDLKMLEVCALEKHDLTLSKVIRCTEHDLQQIAEIHSSVGLSFDVLVQRFCDEMFHVIGDPPRIRGNFLVMIRMLFGDLKANFAEKELSKDRGEHHW
jgi:hypothetical protein